MELFIIILLWFTKYIGLFCNINVAFPFYIWFGIKLGMPVFQKKKKKKKKKTCIFLAYHYYAGAYLMIF
jgi:hypothetical protein